MTQSDQDRLKQLILANDDFELNQYNKIHCKLTGQDIKCDLNEFQQYLNSNHYKIAKDRIINIDQYQPFLQYHKSRDQYAYCLLTKKTLILHGDVIQKHVQGKKFRRIKENFVQRQNQNRKLVIKKLNVRYEQLRTIYRKNVIKLEKKMVLQTKRTAMIKMIKKQSLMNGIFKKFNATKQKKLQDLEKIKK